MDATAHNAKHDKRKNMKSGQREEWIGLILWIIYSYINQMVWNVTKSWRLFHKLSIESKIIKTGFRSEKLCPNYDVLKIRHRMIRRSHFCKHRMNSWEEENKCISIGWSGGTIRWLCRLILCFLGKHAERYSRRNG
jgi:hypothetical protein